MNKIPGYTTDSVAMFVAYTLEVNLNVLQFSIYFIYVSVSGLMYAQEISAWSFVELCLGVVVNIKEVLTNNKHGLLPLEEVRGM